MKFDFNCEINSWHTELKSEKEVNYVFLPFQFPTLEKQASSTRAVALPPNSVRWHLESCFRCKYLKTAGKIFFISLRNSCYRSFLLSSSCFSRKRVIYIFQRKSKAIWIPAWRTRKAWQLNRPPPTPDQGSCSQYGRVFALLSTTASVFGLYKSMVWLQYSLVHSKVILKKKENKKYRNYKEGRTCLFWFPRDHFHSDECSAVK